MDLRQNHIIVQICKSDLRLNHPELCCMAGGIGVFCTESRSERIDVTERLCISLTVQLSAYSQVGRFIEEVFGIIYFSVFRLRYMLFRSMVVTWNISPAPSQSLPVISGVCT